MNINKLHRKRRGGVLAFLPVRRKPLRILSLRKTIAVIYLWKERRGERRREGERSVRASGKQGLSKDNARLLFIWPTQAMATSGKCMAGRRALDRERVLMIVFVGLPPGMCEGIDAPLCGGSNRRMDPRTGLPYFPNQRLSGTVRERIRPLSHYTATIKLPNRVSRRVQNNTATLLTEYLYKPIWIKISGK